MYLLQVTSMAPVASAKFGIDSLHTRDGFLYFTNVGGSTLWRCRINSDRTQAAAYEAVADIRIGGDDFTFDVNEDLFVARGIVDAIAKVTSEDVVTDMFAGSRNPNVPVLLEGNTAMQFGRTVADRRVLYVTTNGGLSGFVDGTAVQGERVLAIEL